jgi:hypothetical protein
MNTQRFALVFGIVFVVIGLAGFVPGLTQEHSHPDVGMTAGLGLLFGLFPVNVLHNIVHLLFGGWGLVASRSTNAALVYAKATAVIYALFTVMGLVPAANLHTTFGLVPLYGHDIWLHAALALVAGYFGFVRRDQQAASRGNTVAG